MIQRIKKLVAPKAFHHFIVAVIVVAGLETSAALMQTHGALHLHGWFFKTATRELFAYETATGQFEPLMAFREGRHA